MSLDMESPVVRDGIRAFMTLCTVSALALTLVTLTGCASPSTEPTGVRPLEVVTAKIAVTEPCIEVAPAEPVYRWGASDLPATDKEKVSIALTDMENAKQYGRDWEAASAGCVKSAAH